MQIKHGQNHVNATKELKLQLPNEKMYILKFFVTMGYSRRFLIIILVLLFQNILTIIAQTKIVFCLFKKIWQRNLFAKHFKTCPSF
jgi:hypothetical protein